MQNKNIIVTGGAGFIGSNLTKRLLELENNVTVIDNFSTGNIDNVNLPVAELRGMSREGYG